jgi:hypothetical protein
MRQKTYERLSLELVREDTLAMCAAQGVPPPDFGMKAMNAKCKNTTKEKLANGGRPEAGPVATLIRCR